MSEQYYIQRKPSGFLGNAPIWWAKGGCGYTAYIQNAEQFTHDEACKLVGDGVKFAMYPCSEINKRLHLVFDEQDFRNLGTDNPCDFTGGKYADLSSVIKQRDELLAALKDIKHRMDDNHLLSRGMVSDICGAAITKVESEK